MGWRGRVEEVCDIFFFSSRRRHTRFDCDWSSDVCSSDLLMWKSTRRVSTWMGTDDPSVIDRSIEYRFSTHPGSLRSEEHTSELQSQSNLVCRLLLEKKKYKSSRNVTQPPFCPAISCLRKR